MKKFILTAFLFAAILSAIGCRQVDELNESITPKSETAKVMKNTGVTSTTKINDSIATTQTLEEKDPPVKGPIKW